MVKYKSTSKTYWLSDPKFFIVIDRNPIITDFKSVILHRKDKFKPIHLEYSDDITDREYIEKAEAIYLIKDLANK